MNQEYVAESFEDKEFSEAELESVLFEDCTFVNCRFQDLEILKSIFRNCDFVQCSWTNISMDEVKFQESRFQGGSIIGLRLNHGLVPIWELAIQDSKLQYCMWEEMNLTTCKWTGSQILECNFYDCNLTAVSFEGSRLTGSEFDRCVMNKVNFADAEGYEFNPWENPVAGATFSSPAVLALLKPLQIEIR